jgi:hypothetical protein
LSLIRGKREREIVRRQHFEPDKREERERLRMGTVGKR